MQERKEIKHKKKENVEHCLKMPQLYKEASRILKRYENKEGSLKSLVYSGKYRRYPVMTGLLSKTIDNSPTLMSAIAASNLLVEQPRFDPYLARILATQLLVKGAVAGECKPIVIFNKYADKIRANAEKGFSANGKLDVKDTLPRYVRVNTLLAGMSRVHCQLEHDGFILDEYDSNMESYDDFLERVENLTYPHYLIDYHIPDLLVFPSNTKFFANVLYKNNAVILQDKASCLPVFVSNVGERSNVIDACAAPGNKTSYIAARMDNKGKVTAVEHNKQRFKTLTLLLRNRQATCVKSLNQDFFKLDKTDYCDVEYIFVDPTCSASGTDVHEDKLSTQRIRGLASVQVMLLSYALSFSGVKEVVYSTCSIYEEENEAVVDEVLQKFGENFRLADLGKKLPGWKHFGNPRYKFGRKCLRTNVEVDKCSGFFVAKFVRRSKSKEEKIKDATEELESLENAAEEPESSENAAEEPESSENAAEEPESPEKVKKASKKRKPSESQDSVENATEELESPEKVEGAGKKKRCKESHEEVDNEEEVELSSKKKKKKKKKEKKVLKEDGSDEEAV